MLCRMTHRSHFNLCLIFLTVAGCTQSTVRLADGTELSGAPRFASGGES